MATLISFCGVLAGVTAAHGDVAGGDAPSGSENFATTAVGSLPAQYRSGSLSSASSPGHFEVAPAPGQNALVDNSATPGDLLYVMTAKPMTSLEETFSFTYSGPASVVAPMLVDSVLGDGGSLQGFFTNLSASAPESTSAGKESFVYAGAGAQRFALVKGRLRTEPYLYRQGHRYRVDMIADPVSHVLSTRVYDVALGAATFDQTIKVITNDLHMYPGLANPLGGAIEIGDFAFGPAGRLPVSPHLARRAADYMNYLGYNAAVNGPVTLPLSRAFVTYFPPLMIKHVRVSVDGGNFAPSLNAVARFGINADVLTGRRTTVASLKRFIAALQLPPDSIELWNEPNNQYEGDAYDANYAVDLPNFAREVAAAFPGVTLWGPSMLADPTGYPNAIATLRPSIGPLITGWNAHSYTRRNPENVGYGPFFARACGVTLREDCGYYGAPNWNDNNSATINPALPGVTTEGAASYGTYPDICGSPQISLSAQQGYVQRGMLYNFKLGHTRIYPYKFIDDGGCSDGFGTYGILSRLRNADRSIRAITPKPAYTALVYLDHILADSGSRALAFTPNSLNYSVQGASPDVEELLLAESDGSYRLVLWSDAPLWNFDANGVNKVGADVALVNDRVTLKLDAPATLTTYTQTPLSGKWNASEAHRLLNLEVRVTQFPLVIAVMPARGNARAVALPRDVATPGPIETFAPKPAATP